MANKGKAPVTWGQFEGAYGGAGEVGELLSLIESGENVWGDLINEVLHQGSLYGATAPVVSRIVKGLKEGQFADLSVPARKDIRTGSLLSQKAEAFIFLSAAAASATRAAKSSPRQARSVLAALRLGIALYKKGLTEREGAVRLASATTWKAVATNRPVAFTAIVRAYDRETDSELRLVTLSALNSLAETRKQWTDRLSSILNSTSPVREKFYAAAYLIARLRNSASEDIANQMAHLYLEIPKDECRYPVEVTNLTAVQDRSVATG
jgi:hypothetical protein